MRDPFGQRARLTNKILSFHNNERTRNLSPGKRTLIAVDTAVKKENETSAYPGSDNFDQEQAQAVMGDMAETVRKWMADKQKCRPPGLQTISNPDGSMKVVADNPEVGIGIEVTISLLSNPSQGQPDNGMGAAPPSLPPNNPMSVGPPAPPQQQPQQSVLPSNYSVGPPQ